jgi:plasmid stabilization system protein ParE
MAISIVWDTNAESSIQNILDYISGDSTVNAGKIADDIILVFEKIKRHPLIYPVDKYKLSKDEMYRAFELHKIRISYKVEEERILIIRCRHTKQRPVYY